MDTYTAIAKNLEEIEDQAALSEATKEARLLIVIATNGTSLDERVEAIAKRLIAFRKGGSK